MNKKLVSFCVSAVTLLSAIGYNANATTSIQIISEETLKVKEAETINRDELVEMNSDTINAEELVLDEDSSVDNNQGKYSNLQGNTESDISSDESGVSAEEKDIDNVSINIPEGTSKRFIVKYKPDAVKISSENTLFTSRSIDENSDIQMILIEDEATGLFGVIEFENGVDEVSFLEQADQLLDMEQIEYIQPDYELTLTAYDEESVYSGINEQLAKNAISSATPLSISNECIVAVIDSGADMSHPIFENKIFTNEIENENGEDNDNNGYIDDINGWNFCDKNNIIYDGENRYEYNHGTHVAGIIAQSASNVKILSLKAFKNGTAYTSDVIEAINYAKSMGASIINCSFGTTEENQALRETIENTEALFVCASGNGRMNIDETPVYPAAYRFDNVISVASMNKFDGISYFSNYGITNVDIAAYGEEIYSSYPENSYGKFSGTSMAAAFVSGTAAQLCSENDFIASELKEQILNCSDKYSSLENKVCNMRRLNAENILGETVVDNAVSIDYDEEAVYPIYDTTTEEGMALFSLPTVSVAAGEKCSFLVKSDGSVWMWGTPGEGVANNELPNERINSPTRLRFIDNVQKICSSETHTVVLKKDGTVWGWGNNVCYSLGYYDENKIYPSQIFGDDATDISVNEASTIVVFDHEVIRSGWDYFHNGQDIGFGMFNDYGPSTVPVENGVKVVSRGMGNGLNVGGDIILTSDGNLYELGRRYENGGINSASYSKIGEYSIIGDGFHVSSFYAANNNGFYENEICINSVGNPNEIVDISSSIGTKTLILYANGDVYQLGTEIGHLSNDNGAGTRFYAVDEEADYSFEKINELSNIVSISCGGSHYIALDSGGEVYCWGDNTYGQCGIDGKDFISVPHSVCSTTVSDTLNIDFVEIDKANNTINICTSCGEGSSLNPIAVKLSRVIDSKTVYVGQAYCSDFSEMFTVKMPEGEKGFYRLSMRMDDEEMQIYDFFYPGNEDVKVSVQGTKVTVSGDLPNNTIIKVADKNGDIIYVANELKDSPEGKIFIMPNRAKTGEYIIKLSVPNYGITEIKEFEYIKPNIEITSCVQNKNILTVSGKSDKESELSIEIINSDGQTVVIDTGLSDETGNYCLPLIIPYNIPKGNYTVKVHSSASNADAFKYNVYLNEYSDSAIILMTNRGDEYAFELTIDNFQLNENQIYSLIYDNRILQLEDIVVAQGVNIIYKPEMYTSYPQISKKVEFQIENNLLSDLSGAVIIIKFKAAADGEAKVIFTYN